jgi:hypothetical protein
VVNELTVKDMDATLAAIDQKRPDHWAEILLDTKIPVEIVTASTGLQAGELEEMTPTELEVVWGAVARVNDFLSRGLTRLGDIAEKLAMARAESHSGESSVS